MILITSSFTLSCFWLLFLDLWSCSIWFYFYFYVQKLSVFLFFGSLSYYTLFPLPSPFFLFSLFSCWLWFHLLLLHFNNCIGNCSFTYSSSPAWWPAFSPLSTIHDKFHYTYGYYDDNLDRAHCGAPLHILAATGVSGGLFTQNVMMNEVCTCDNALAVLCQEVMQMRCDFNWTFNSVCSARICIYLLIL